MLSNSNLAVNGGSPVRKRNWPTWPPATPAARRALDRVLTSGRWTISGPSNGAKPEECLFAEEFARFNGTRFCVPTANGSSALVIAMEALDIGPGDEVIVPALTWVATASAVLRVGATPVLTDVNRGNFCLSAEAAEAAITPRTKAIIVVHLHHSMADMDSFLALSERTGIPIIEDTAQAHGAIWRGARAGTLGIMGTFSFQQSKVITSGEGGAVITRDEQLFQRLQELRADSRSWSTTPRASDGMQLLPHRGVMGANYCLSDFHAALLRDHLSTLETQLSRQAENAAYLERQLETLGPFRPLRQPAGLARRTVYEFLIEVNRAAFEGRPIEAICRALRAELDLPFYPPDAPLHRSLLFRPESKRRFWMQSDALRKLENSARFPNAEHAAENCFIIFHSAFLGTREDMDDIVTACEKVLAHVSQIPTL